jgi:hypothetical protein
VAYKASQNASGWTNPIEVRCGKCNTKQYIKGGVSEWDCFACGHRN